MEQDKERAAAVLIQNYYRRYKQVTIVSIAPFLYATQEQAQEIALIIFLSFLAPEGFFASLQVLWITLYYAPLNK